MQEFLREMSNDTSFDPTGSTWFVDCEASTPKTASASHGSHCGSVQEAAPQHHIDECARYPLQAFKLCTSISCDSLFEHIIASMRLRSLLGLQAVYIDVRAVLALIERGSCSCSERCLHPGMK